MEERRNERKEKSTGRKVGWIGPLGRPVWPTGHMFDTPALENEVQ